MEGVKTSVRHSNKIPQSYSRRGADSLSCAAVASRSKAAHGEAVESE